MCITYNITSCFEALPKDRPFQGKKNITSFSLSKRKDKKKKNKKKNKYEIGP